MAPLLAHRVAAKLGTTRLTFCRDGGGWRVGGEGAEGAEGKRYRWPPDAIPVVSEL